MELPVTQIVKGHINELVGLNADLVSNRMEICRKCPIFNPDYGGICSRQLYINPETNEASDLPYKGYIQGCGCRLLAKTTLPYAKCIAGKW